MKLGHGQGFRLSFFKPTNTLNSYQICFKKLYKLLAYILVFNDN